MSVSGVPGFDVLGLSDNGQPASPSSSSTNSSSGGSASSTSTPSTPASAASSSTENPYQQTYDQIETWSNQYLMQAMEYGAPPIPQYTAGGSVDSFAQLTNMLAAIQPGVENGSYGGGTGTNVNATA